MFSKYHLMRKVLYALAIIGILISCQQNQDREQETNFISVEGPDIIGVDGLPFYPKGTNLGNWLVPEGYMFKFRHSSSPRLIQDVLNQLIGPEESRKFWNQYLENYIRKEDIQYLKRMGMNSIRIPFHYKLFTNEDYLGGRGSDRGFALLDSAVKWCKGEELYVILDMHCAPGGQTGDNIDDSWGYPFLFDSKESQDMIVDIWSRIADHYSSEPIIMGYDLMNEPIAHFFDTAHFVPNLEPLYRRITSAIREVDQNHLILYGGAQWNSNFSMFSEPFDDKAVYTFHKYWTPTTIDVIQQYIDFRDKYQVPIYCGETGENTDEWVRNFRTLLDEQKIGWHFWPYKKMDNPRGIASFPVPDGYDQVKNFADTTRITFADLRNVRPENMTLVKSALDQFLENCLFENCYGNRGYIEALGFDYQ